MKCSNRTKLVGLVVAFVAVFVMLPNQAIAETPVISGFASALRSAMLWTFTTVLDWLTPLFQAVADAMFAQSPDLWAEHRANVWAIVGPVYATADLWFPVSEITVLLTTYCIYIGIVALTKWIFKAAPFVG